MDSNKQERTGSKTSLWKLFFGLIFFPFTISYLVLKQKQVPLIGRVAIVGLFWVIFIGIGSSSNTDKEQATKATVTATPTVVAISLEQKQADFKEVYQKYQTQSQAMITIQVGIQQLSSLASNKAELYLALEKLEKTQSSIAWSNLDITTPDSLKEYKQIGEALGDFKIAGNNFTDAIKKMKEYVNKEDLKNLSQAKEQLDRGVARLTDSKNKMDAVAKELNVDLTTISNDK